MLSAHPGVPLEGDAVGHSALGPVHLLEIVPKEPQLATRTTAQDKGRPHKHKVSLCMADGVIHCETSSRPRHPSVYGWSRMNGGCCSLTYK